MIRDKFHRQLQAIIKAETRRSKNSTIETITVCSQKQLALATTIIQDLYDSLEDPQDAEDALLRNTTGMLIHELKFLKNTYLPKTCELLEHLAPGVTKR